MNDLVAGFLKFRETAYSERIELFRHLAHTQAPSALFITCSDSRVIPELLTQREPGDLFVIRNAGNIVPPYEPDAGGVSAAVEYAVDVLGVRDIVICGHSDCGAMTAVAHRHDLKNLPAIRSWLRNAETANAAHQCCHFGSDAEHVAAVVRDNVVAQLHNLRTHTSVARALSLGKLRLHGWVYDIGSGHVDALDGLSGQFVSLVERPEVFALTSGARTAASGVLLPA